MKKIKQAQIQRAEWLRHNVHPNPYTPMGDPLSDRYHELAFVTEFNEEYAADWQRLGNDAARADRPSMAEMCYARAKHYAELDGGHYYRIVDGCLAELRPAPKAGGA